MTHPIQYQKSWREREQLAKLRRSRYEVSDEVRAGRNAMRERLEAEAVAQREAEREARERPMREALELVTKNLKPASAKIFLQHLEAIDPIEFRAALRNALA